MSVVRRSFLRDASAEDTMSGLCRPFLWAVTCLAAICLQNALSVKANVTEISVGVANKTSVPPTKITPTTVTSALPTTVPTLGGRRPNGLPAFARPAEPHSFRGARGWGWGRARAGGGGGGGGGGSRNMAARRARSAGREGEGEPSIPWCCTLRCLLKLLGNS